MPLYRYICSSCKHEFDKLVPADTRDNQDCKQCGKEAERDISTGFSVATEIDPKRQSPVTPKEIDKVVGKDAEERWEVHEGRTQERRKGMKEIDTGIKSGDFNPISVLGSKEDQKLGEYYSEGLKAHREERESKGIKQFND